MQTKEIYVSLPAKIKDERVKQLFLLEEYLEVAEKVKKLTESQYLEVLKHVDEKGKKLYPNDALRKEATQARLEEKPEYSNLKTRESNLEIDMKKADIEIEFLRNQFRMLEASGALKEEPTIISITKYEEDNQCSQ